MNARPIASATVLLALCSLSTATCPGISPPPETPSTAVYCVDLNGCCSFSTVQAAIDAVPDSSSKRSILWINAGTFVEKVHVPREKTNVTFQGQGFGTTLIVWNDTATSAHSTGGSASVYIEAPGFVAKNISFKNSSPAPKPGAKGEQAVALRIAGDQAAFWGCGFYSNQDTLLDELNRHYFKECYIEGSIDFIFVDARSLYKDCTINSVAEAVPKGEQPFVTGAITAQARSSPYNNTGFSFVDCTIQGSGYIDLGRAWQPFARVIFSRAYMPDIISQKGWDDWQDATRDSTVFFAEHACYGEGSNLSGRVGYAKRLDDEEARNFTTLDYIDGQDWLVRF